MTARHLLCRVVMLNQNTFKKVSMTLGLISVASLANDASAFAAPRRPTNPVLQPAGRLAHPPVAAAASDRTVQIPERDAGYGGIQDSEPYHLTGRVVYEHIGYDPVPRSLGVALKEIHILGWLDSNGHLDYPCGKFTIDAKHVSINGQDYSGRLVFDGGIFP